jgi:hypothetical protein
MNAITEAVQLTKVTRYNGEVGYKVAVGGKHVGEVHRQTNGRGWAFAAQATGVYANGHGRPTRQRAVDALVGAYRAAQMGATL